MSRKRSTRKNRRRSSSSRGVRKTIVAFLALVALSGGGWVAYESLNDVTSNYASEVQPETVEATEGTVTVSVESPARTEPYVERTVRAATSGCVSYIAKPGERLSEGEALVEFGTEDLERSVVRAGIALDDATIRKQRAEQNLAGAERHLSEQEQLYESGAISREELERAGEELHEQQRDFRTAELSVERAELDVAEAEADSEEAVISAPFDGTVLDVEVAEGERVSQNSRLLSFADVSRVRFVAEMDEYDVRLLEEGMPVSIRSDVLPEHTLRGRVEEISPEAELVENIPVFGVSTTAENEDGAWRPGMNADLNVRIHRDEGIVVPAAAVSTVQSATVVHVLSGEEEGDTADASDAAPDALEFAASDAAPDASQSADNRFEAREVELGAHDGIEAVIHEGLDEGELVRIPEEQGVLPDSASDEAASDNDSSAIPLPGVGSPGESETGDRATDGASPGSGAGGQGDGTGGQ